MDRIVGRVPVGNEMSAGIGRIIIPSDIEREQYVKTCLSQNKVSIIDTEYGRVYRDVSVSIDLMNNLKFPQNYNDYGSQVVFVNIPIHNYPVIVAIISYTDDKITNNSESQFVLKRADENGVVDVTGDSKNTALYLSADSRSSDGGKIFINCSNKTLTSKFVLNVLGSVDLLAARLFYLKSLTGITLEVSDATDQQNTIHSKISIEKNGIFKYEDKNSNSISIDSNGISVKNQQGYEVKLTSEGIKIGNGNEEPNILGNKFVSLMQDLITQISILTVPTGVGPSGVPLNVSEFQRISESLQTLLSQEVKIQ